MVLWGAATLVAYLLGSIPSGLWIGRFVFRIDPRDYGSRSTGMTNVLRTMGKKAAAAVLFLDLAKGAVAVTVARALLPEEPWAHVLAAFAAAAGHNWPIFSEFRGGKGVVVSGVAIGVLYWPILATIIPVGIITVYLTRFVSVGSIMGALVTAGLGIALYSSDTIPLAYLFYFVVASALVLWTHRSNVARLVAGTENKIGHRVQTAA
ncbi:MAG: glycerol-3-phosphate 1-O-acyltransferase PlsY [Chloroflexota bacterium]